MQIDVVAIASGGRLLDELLLLQGFAVATKFNVSGSVA